MDEFGSGLRGLRQSRQWTLAELAARVGVSEQSLWNWEHGRHEPSTAELPALVKALELNAVEELRLTRSLKATRFQRAVVVPGMEAEAGSQARPTMGDLLRALRQRRGLSRAALAGQVGVPLGTLTRWEHSTRYPSEAYLERLLALLRAHPAEAAALRDRRLGSEPLAMLHLDALADRAQYIEHVCDSPAYELGDLTALSLMHALWPHALRSASARYLLGRVSAYYGAYLTYQARHPEALRYTAQAEAFLPPLGRGVREAGPHITIVYNRISAPDPSRNPAWYAATVRYLTRLPVSENATLRCYIQSAAANYAFRLDHREAALSLARSARESYRAQCEGSSEAHEPPMMMQVIGWQEAVLSSNFRKGWDLQPEITPETHFTAALGVRLAAARLHLRGGSRATAEQYLREAFTLVEEHRFENARRWLDWPREFDLPEPGRTAP